MARSPGQQASPSSTPPSSVLIETKHRYRVYFQDCKLTGAMCSPEMQAIAAAQKPLKRNPKFTTRAGVCH
jgi:hypothetical protein